MNATLTVFLLAAAQDTVTVDGAQQFQRMDGFGTNVNGMSWSNGEARPAIDFLVDPLGGTVFRVILDNMDWEAANDDSDPNTFNWTYYNSVFTSARFNSLWETIRYLNQKGINANVMLNFMGPLAPWMAGSGPPSGLLTSMEDEFVETVLAVAVYARNTANVQFGLFAPCNELDWDGFEGPQIPSAQYVRVMRRIVQRLPALGLGSLRLVGPDTASVGSGVGDYIPAMLADATIMGQVDHFALHNYGGSTGGADALIRGSAYPAKNFWMTECFDPTALMQNVRDGAASALTYDGFDAFYNHHTFGNGPAFNTMALLAYNSTSRTYSPRKVFYQTAQIFKWVPAGAFRIQASTSGANWLLLAFHSTSPGRITIVGRNSGGTRTLNGTLLNLPAVSALEYTRTTASVDLLRGTDVAVSGGAFSLSVPGDSFFTLTALTGASPGNQPPTVSITAPSSGAAFTAPGTITITATANDPDGSVTQVEFFQGSTLLGQDAGAPYSYTWNSVPAGTYTLTARATDNLGATATSAPVTVTVNPGGGGSLPPPWQTQDIGTVGQAGSASFSAGLFTAQGSGDDIWNAADAFRLVYQPLSGDGEIVARVAGLQNTNPWAKAGVMIRETLTAGSAHAATFVTPSNGVAFQRRVTSGGTSAGTAGPAVAAPTWLRLARAGSTFTGYSSPDGVSWTQVGSDTIAMGAGAFVGLAVTAHDNALLATATFDGVSVTSSADTDGDGMSDAFETGFGFDPANPDQDANGTLDGLDDWDVDTTPNASDPSPGSPPGTGAGGAGGGGGGGCGALGLDALALLGLVVALSGRSAGSRRSG